MPYGQWVAFEGYNNIHDCSKPIKKEPWKRTNAMKETNDIEFIDIKPLTSAMQHKKNTIPIGRKYFLGVLILIIIIVLIYVLNQ